MKNGFRILDSDLHTMEPDDLWERYLDEPFRDAIPKFEREKDGPSQQPTIIAGALKIGEGTMLPQSVRVEARLQDMAQEHLTKPEPEL